MIDIPGIYIGAKPLPCRGWSGRRGRGDGYAAVPLGDSSDVEASEDGGPGVASASSASPDASLAGYAPNPEMGAGIVSRMFFTYVNAMLATGYLRPLGLADMYQLMPVDDPTVAFRKLRRGWLARGSESVIWALARGWGWLHLVNWIFLAIATAAELAGPLFIHAILRCLASSATCGSSVWIYVVALSATQILRVLANARFSYFMKRYCTAAKSALQVDVFDSLLGLTAAGCDELGKGKIINLVGVDAGTIRESLSSVHLAVITPVQLALGFYLLFSFLGVSVLAGLASLVALLPLNLMLARGLKQVEKRVMVAKDARNKAIADMLGGIRVVKLLGWETFFSRKIGALRATEQAAIQRRGVLLGLGRLLNAIIPSLVSGVTFAVYVARGNVMTPAATFASLSLFSILQGPLDSVARELLAAYATGKVAASRLSNFAGAPQRHLPPLAADPLAPREQPLALCGTYAWASDDPSPVLYDLDLVFPPNSLTLLMGPVGCGKSAILLALLGELEVLSPGSPQFPAGSPRPAIAYAPQRPWLLSASLRANIVLDAEFDAPRYAAALTAAGLEHDLTLLPAGDATEIGEKGVNISGGQKQRVALARVLYSRAPIVLLDDPLSAVDPEQAATIFEAAIRPLAERAVVVVATHSLAFEQIPGLRIYHVAAGRAELASPRTLAAQESSNEPAALPAGTLPDDNRERAPHDAAAVAAGAKLKVKEDRASGSVVAKDYLQYARALGWTAVGTIALGLVAMEALDVGRNMWLSKWTHAASERGGADNSKYLGGYFGLIVASGVATALTATLVFTASAVAGTKYHAAALVGVTASPLTFFDATPLGRILNRFSKDVADMDSGVLPVLVRVIMTLLKAGAVVCVIGAATPWFLLAVPFIALTYYPVSVVYQRSKRELQRTGSIVTSPLIAHVAGVIEGLASVRAYGLEESFADKHTRNVEATARVWNGKVNTNRWLLLRLSLLGGGVVSLSGCLAVSAASQGTITAATAGLALLYASQLTGALIQLCAAVTRVEVRMNAVERLGHYFDLPSEARAVGGPQNGTAAARWRVVDARAKVGICGASGAGKSSLLAALFQTVPLAGGSIRIDGDDIREVGLVALRRSLAIIPQDAQLFLGTLAFNMDPTGTTRPEAMWQALEAVGMAEVLRDKAYELDADADPLDLELKNNLSCGEAQLVCMARALVRDARIIVIDEGTASVDAESDARIQHVIRTAFADRTVLTIAHRLATLADYDRLLVMVDGEVAEYDTPAALLAAEDSIYGRLVAAQT
ncbi:multidrug resistance-associated protein Mrp2 [Thecamonas trahens ATCC 50062]|uniref:Multidrug resistance-associated protein Mrp2 n=1 Tax=Thecamonas trahens ATCC 50062 TaxID=461836 RepID=A0A0L0D885_THETB|nr:multidrug resistance-associated protein Mrp2 [Thecamonas trahens ATCC 50062]KNC48450.1 multidrug resistance-associated protein Mrp2 [Thecamonas trahens ATCC 50062]|eukprot:XP_013758563.1 multidrug resistance-associated protein Mrp2 [Thecamonas trahens ATCC 50062]